ASSRVSIPSSSAASWRPINAPSRVFLGSPSRRPRQRNRPRPRPARRRLDPDMARRRQPDSENHDRWLVSYADFITLLFAFFVVMFATSQTDNAKAQQVSDSVKKALAGQPISAVLA